MRATARLFAGTVLATTLAILPGTAFAQDAADTSEPQNSGQDEVIVVTGSRIQRTEVTATSPVTSFDQEQIELDRAVTIEDITARVPQFAGGVNSTQTGSAVSKPWLCASRRSADSMPPVLDIMSLTGRKKAL